MGSESGSRSTGIPFTAPFTFPCRILPSGEALLIEAFSTYLCSIGLRMESWGSLGLKARVTEARLLATKTPLLFTQTESAGTLGVPTEMPDTNDAVISLKTS